MNAPIERHKDLTRDIIGCAMEVSNELGSGFVESVYESALSIALTDKGIVSKCQVPIDVVFRGHHVGSFFADMLVEEKVIIELKAARALLPEHEAQTINYLKATGIEVGLLINFGKPKLEFRRFTRTK